VGNTDTNTGAEWVRTPYPDESELGEGTQLIKQEITLYETPAEGRGSWWTGTDVIADGTALDSRRAGAGRAHS
jgi:hypothetical protein